MTTPREILAACLAFADTDPRPDRQAVDKYADLLSEIAAESRRIAAAATAEDTRHREADLALRRAVKGVQERCPHPEGMQEHFSGYESSYTECRLCGKEAR